MIASQGNRLGPQRFLGLPSITYPKYSDRQNKKLGQLSRIRDLLWHCLGFFKRLFHIHRIDFGQ